MSMPKIFAALENQQVDHQTSMVDIEGIIKGKPVFILYWWLIVPVATYQTFMVLIYIIQLF